MMRACVQLIRRPMAVGGARRLLSTAKKPAFIEKSLSSDGVLTVRFDNEKKLNAWTMPLLRQLFDSLQAAGTDSDVAGVIVTGKGNYYSAGVDLSAMIKPMAPAKLQRQIRDSNEQCFRAFLDFPKPIIAAVNGPAIGAAVTSTILMDAVVASESATFSLPFAKLGVPPEGCSSVTFPERMGDKNAHRMLGPENWVPTGAEAHAAGLIDEVVSAEALEDRCAELIRERIASGGGRRFDEAEHTRLRRVNALESAQLANAFVSHTFLNAMYEFNVKRKKTQLQWVFWTAKTTLPLWKPADILPSDEE